MRGSELMVSISPSVLFDLLQEASAFFVPTSPYSLKLPQGAFLILAKLI